MLNSMLYSCVFPTIDVCCRLILYASSPNVGVKAYLFCLGLGATFSFTPEVLRRQQLGLKNNIAEGGMAEAGENGKSKKGQSRGRGRGKGKGKGKGKGDSKSCEEEEGKESDQHHSEEGETRKEECPKANVLEEKGVARDDETTPPKDAASPAPKGKPKSRARAKAKSQADGVKKTDKNKKSVKNEENPAGTSEIDGEPEKIDDQPGRKPSVAGDDGEKGKGQSKRSRGKAHCEEIDAKAIQKSKRPRVAKEAKGCPEAVAADGEAAASEASMKPEAAESKKPKNPKCAEGEPQPKRRRSKAANKVEGDDEEKKEGEVELNSKVNQEEKDVMKSFARRARPTSNALAMEKWDAIRDIFNSDLRPCVNSKASMHEDFIGVLHLFNPFFAPSILSKSYAAHCIVLFYMRLNQYPGSIVNYSL